MINEFVYLTSILQPRSQAEMSIAVENLPLPHRRHLENLIPRRCRAATLQKAKATAPLPRRCRAAPKSNLTAPLPHRALSKEYLPLPRRHRDGIDNIV